MIEEIVQTVRNHLSENDLLRAKMIGAAQAGFYSLKTVGYYWLKEAVKYKKQEIMESDDSEKIKVLDKESNNLLSSVKRSFMLPTPIDLVALYMALRIFKKRANDSISM